MSPKLDSEGQDESLPVAMHSDPHLLEYSVTVEYPTMIQQVVGTEEVSEPSRIDGDNGSGDRQTRGEIHASD